MIGGRVVMSRGGARVGAAMVSGAAVAAGSSGWAGAMKRWWWLVMVASLVAAGCGDDETQASVEDAGQGDALSPTPDVAEDAAGDADAAPEEVAQEAAAPTRWVVQVAADAPEAVRWTAEDVVGYLERMGREVTLEEAGAVARCTPGEGRAVFVGDGLGEVGLGRVATPQTWRITETRCEDGGARVELAGGGLLGRQYAGYEWMHQLGVRYFHPEEEFVPEAPRWPEAPLDLRQTPDFRWRSVSLHLTHPLELGDYVRRGDAAYADEFRRYIDWQIKNLASFGSAGAGGGELSDYGLRRGFAPSAGFSLHNQQQGASNVIDPDDPRCVSEGVEACEAAQLTEAIEARMGVEPTPEFFSFTFNPSEFTELEDTVIVRQLTFIADHFAEHYPTVHLTATNHGTAGPPTPNYGVRYYDLAQFAPPNLGMKMHTLMFYDLFRPAPVYGNEDFNHTFEFMVDNHQTRPLWHFPEAAWWLTFDIALPLYLPITIEARDRDIQGIAFMLEGKLDGHRVFGTGHEWGYWQNEYCPFRMAADVSYRYTDCLADIAWATGGAADEVQAVLEATIALQERDFIYDEQLLAYLVGTDPETEVAASVGIVFHPLPPAPGEMMTWDLAAVERWRRRIEPALARMEADYAALVARLEAVAERVPASGRPWFDEIRDGLEVTGLRARHQREAYGAVVSLRESQLRFEPALAEEAEALLAAARATTEAARAVVARRELGYRYQPLSRAIGGGPDGTEDDNWTVYGYRYLNRTHHVYYYARVDALVAEALAGSGQVVTVDDALLAPGESLRVAASDTAVTELRVELGDGQSAEGLEVVHDYAAPGVYSLLITGARDGAPFEVEGAVASLVVEHQTGLTGRVIEPPGVELIEAVMPGLVAGVIDDETAALGFALDAGGAVGLGLWSTMTREAPVDGASLAARADQVVVPIVSRGEVQASIIVEDALLVVDEAMTIRGQLSTDAVVDAIVSIGGFDEVGARATVAQALGYTPETLPARLPFVIAYELQAP